MKAFSVMVFASMVSFGLLGCDSKDCEVVSCSGASGGSGYSCDNEPTVCWETLTECQNSSNCE